ncbi:odorant receptor Or2 [Monomorium pharaonis]|uniref:odorant receptor Or2 n=1 Tax=Monomorium pharaonis TaxID=307658 RepID=UPI00063F3059|nr:odorant receptor Or2 [Monomorium pharaonis]
MVYEKKMAITEMRMLSRHFFAYTIGGLWRPIEWSSKYSKSLYNVFTFFTMYLFTYLLLTHGLHIIFVVDNLESLISSSSVFFSFVGLMCKATTVVVRRDRIINLLEIIQEEPCKVCDEDEIDIQMKFDRLLGLYSMPYIILCAISAVGTLIGCIIYMMEGVIPIGTTWVPWDCTSPFIFYLTSLQVVAALMLAIFVNIGSETTILGFCLQTCAQFEILKHRLQRMMKNNKNNPMSSLNNALNRTSRISEHVFYHLCIIRLAKTINDVFSPIIFVQFFVSILLLCSVIYRLSSQMVIADLASLSTYTIILFIQIFYYCWGGNEVMLKSVELGQEIYHMDWISMAKSEQKDLLMIMKRSTKPIRFTSSFLVTMSLESYGNLLKAAFSAFNLMQQL